MSPTGQDKVVARSVIENLYGGCVIRENWMPADGTAGGSLNTFDPADNRWHQVWMDASNARVSFDGELVGRQHGPDRKLARRPEAWAGRPGPDDLQQARGGAVRQKGEISTDNGATLEAVLRLHLQARRIAQIDCGKRRRTGFPFRLASAIIET